MTISLKIFITKDETSKRGPQSGSEKIIPLDEPIILTNCSKMFVKSVSIFWNYNNL